VREVREKKKEKERMNVAKKNGEDKIFSFVCC
jgi:hypothetical protein